MIQMQTLLDVADNSGAKSARCIKVLGGTRRRYAGLGDIVVVSVQKAIAGSAIKAGSVVKGVVVRVKKSARRADGLAPPPSYGWNGNHFAWASRCNP